MKKFFVLLVLIVLIIVGDILLLGQWEKNSAISLAQREQFISTAKSIRGIDHVIVIMMENKSYDDIVGNADAPYSNSLIHQYAFADNYYGVTHPSLPNYLAMIGGDTFGITSDCTDCQVHAPNLIDQLEKSGKSWKAYMQSMPSACFIGDKYPYAQKHNPFIYLDDIRNNPQRCSQVVPLSNLPNDLRTTKTTPNFIWISPNLCSDTHDCPAKTGDTWLSREVPALLHSPAFTAQHSILFITWDEGEDTGGNHIPTIIIGSTVKNAYVSQVAYTHYSLLHTIELLWNLPALTSNVSASTPMADIFQKNQ